jgi:RND family efflux transporter MFP subunit
MRNSRLSLKASRVAACLAAFTCVTLGWSVSARAADAADGDSVAVQTLPVQRASLAQPVRGYGIVGASAANVTTLDLPYVARITQLRVQAGQTVTRGTPLVVVLADPAAVLAAAQARSAATLAQGELARTQSLYDKQLATQSQLAAARKALQDAQQALAAQDQMGVNGGGKIITAPLDGVVLQVSVAQGDQVQAGAPILQLAAAGSGEDARANVMLGVEPADATTIHTGDTVFLRGLSSALAHQAVTGRVVMVGGSVDSQSQLVNVGANVPLGKTALIPGTRVSADIATLGATYWVVPRSSVLKDDNGEYVFQVAPDHKVHRVSVVTKVEDSERYGVGGALDASRPLVVSGNYELKDGMAVRTGRGTAP